MKLAIAAVLFAALLSCSFPSSVPVTQGIRADTPGGPIATSNAAAPMLFYAFGSDASSISVNDSNGNELRELPIPRGIIGSGGMTIDPAGTLYAVAGIMARSGESQAAYAFNAPYASAVPIGTAAQALVDNPVALCAPAPGALYLVNTGAGKLVKKFGWNTQSVLFLDPATGWTKLALPNREQSETTIGGGRDGFGNCYFPGVAGVEQYTGGAKPLHVVKYSGSELERGFAIHGSLAVGPNGFAYANNRKIFVYEVAGRGAMPMLAYSIPRPWPENRNHVGGAFSRIAYDGQGVLYSPHPHYSECASGKACYWVTAIYEYRPGETMPFLRARLPRVCSAGNGDCLTDMAVSADGHIFALLGRNEIVEFLPGHSQPSMAIVTTKFISSIYAAH